MIEIAISRELADEHPRFMARCATRGYPVDVLLAPPAHTEAPPVDSPPPMVSSPHRPDGLPLA